MCRGRLAQRVDQREVFTAPTAGADRVGENHRRASIVREDRESAPRVEAGIFGRVETEFVQHAQPEGVQPFAREPPRRIGVGFEE